VEFLVTGAKTVRIVSESSWIYAEPIQPPGYSEPESFLMFYGEYGQITAIPFGGKVEISAC